MVTELRSTVDAVVLREFNAPLSLITVRVPEPGPGAVVACADVAGFCGTDAHLHYG